jgi:phosphate starvation-inducible PhoH-like protein
LANADAKVLKLSSETQDTSQSNGGSSTDGAVQLLEFADNRLAQSLYGEHDRHLARIEQKFDVTVTPRGNKVSIKGDQNQAAQVASVLSELYERLTRGQEILQADVDAAIRLAQAAEASGRGVMNDDRFLVRTTRRMISPRSQVQAEYIEAMNGSDLTLALGPAGTGKTYLAVAVAVSMLLRGQVDRLVLSRPAVEAGERLGFLPGDMRDKVDPYLRPLYDALFDMLPYDQVERRLESGEIEIAPLAFMRGRTLSNSFVILDEAQNASPMQMKMFLTRLGENSRMAVTGDPTQVDLPAGMQSGLMDAWRLLQGVKGVSFVRFGEKDVVRHGLVTRIVAAYNARDAGAGKAAHNDPTDEDQ